MHVYHGTTYIGIYIYTHHYLNVYETGWLMIDPELSKRIKSNKQENRQKIF